MTAAQLLAIPINRPEALYPGDLNQAHDKFRQLAKVWHQDVIGTGNKDVFAHIVELYRQALVKIKAGKWEGAGRIEIVDVSGVTRVLQARATAPCDVGQMVMTDTELAYLVESKFHKGWQHASERQFKFRDPAMKKEFARYLPVDLDAIKLDDGRWLWQVPKTPDLLRLRDVVTHQGALDPKHVAWVVSSLMNLVCYLEYTDIVHMDISPDTYFISPEFHSGALLGGWWHWAKIGEPITHVPRRTFDNLPFSVAVTKRATSLIDLDLVRATGREIMAGNAPAPMQRWLETPGSGSAVVQYKQWHSVLKQAFGERRFVKMDLTADAVYGQAVAH